MNVRKRKYGLQTRLTHNAQEANNTSAVSPPIFQTSTFGLQSPEEGADLAAQIAPTMYYTRYGSPNTKQAEELLIAREVSEAVGALGSAMARITTSLVSSPQSCVFVVAQMAHYSAPT